MDLRRLLDPRSVAVVGASDREGSYGGQTLVNLRTLGYEGDVWPVNPRRDRVYGLDCFPSLGELPGVLDAVVVAVPAASVPEQIADAGRLGCGGAVVYGAGFAEIEGGRSLQDELVEAARRHELPLCGPNGNGIVVFPRRVAIWGDALSAREHGDVAIVSRAATRPSTRCRTAAGCASTPSSRAATRRCWRRPTSSTTLRTRARCARWRSTSRPTATGRGCDALAACADAGIGVAVLKGIVGGRGVRRRGAHGRRGGGPARVLGTARRGAVPVTDPHDLLEVAKTPPCGERLIKRAICKQIARSSEGRPRARPRGLLS